MTVANYQSVPAHRVVIIRRMLRAAHAAIDEG
jgi:hypothetical protein